MAEKPRPTHSVFSVYCGTQVEVCSCVSGNDVLCASDVLFDKLVVGVDSGYFRRGDEKKACSLGRRHASPGFPWRVATPHGAACTEYKTPMKGVTASDSLGLLRILQYASRGPSLHFGEQRPTI